MHTSCERSADSLTAALQQETEGGTVMEDQAPAWAVSLQSGVAASGVTHQEVSGLVSCPCILGKDTKPVAPNVSNGV